MNDIKRLLIIIAKGANDIDLTIKDKHFLFNIEKELEYLEDLE